MYETGVNACLYILSVMNRVLPCMQPRFVSNSIFMFRNMFSVNELTKIFHHPSKKKMLLLLTTLLKVKFDPLELELVMV